MKPSDNEEVSWELSMEGEGKKEQDKGEFEWVDEEKAAKVDVTKAVTILLSLFLWASCWRR